MRFYGKVYRDGNFWLAEVPIFEAMTQGRTRKEALLMIGDWFESMINKPGFSATIYPGNKGEFEVGAEDVRAMIGLLLKRQREISGLSLAEAAERLGAKSRNAFARYEHGTSVPSIEKLDHLLRAVSPGRDFVLRQSMAS